MQSTGNEFLTLAGERYSVRSFTRKAVTREHMDKILRAGQLAPTACNLQPQRIIVINDPDSVEKLRKCTPCHFGASSALLVCYDKNECWVRDLDGKASGEVDAAIVATHMMMEAWELGVGSTWVMYFIPEAVRAEFNLPEGVEPVALLVLGYPSQDAKPYAAHTSFRPLEQLVIQGGYPS